MQKYSVTLLKTTDKVNTIIFLLNNSLISSTVMNEAFFTSQVVAFFKFILPSYLKIFPPNFLRTFEK